jgi:hypothetical protein
MEKQIVVIFIFQSFNYYHQYGDSYNTTATMIMQPT